jgi:hypothetical protein
VVNTKQKQKTKKEEKKDRPVSIPELSLNHALCSYLAQAEG